MSLLNVTGPRDRDSGFGARDRRSTALQACEDASAPQRDN